MERCKKISDSDIETISDHVLAEAQKITQSHYAFFGLLSEDKNKMILHAWSHETMEECKTSKKKIFTFLSKKQVCGLRPSGKKRF